MSSQEQIKIMMLKERLTAKQLASILAEKTGKHYTHQSLLHKISLSSLRYDEMETIADILGYEIIINKK
jgi:transposase